MATEQHRWSFFRAGGVDQVVLRDGKDLAHLSELDPKLWVALSMPTRGVAIGGIGAMVAGVLTAFFGLGAWMPAGVIALFFLISGPSMLLAFIKLRQRNLGPLLDANGWAINARARINVPFGGALTDIARIPLGAERSLADPYAEKHRPWKLYVLVVALLGLGAAWYFGRLDHLLPERLQAGQVLSGWAPSAPATATGAAKE